jgi:hypothetical protein
MEEKKREQMGLNEEEVGMIKKLRQQPKIMERVQKILEITGSEEGPLKTADQVEDLLIEEMRRLGKATMNEWATQAEERVGRELKQEHPTVLKRKKKR